MDGSTKSGVSSRADRPPAPRADASKAPAATAFDGKDPAQALMRSLLARRLFFFAGAGVSVESELPAAVGLIGPAAQRLLPTYASRGPSLPVTLSNVPKEPGASRDLAFGVDILPEEFYSIALDMVGPDDASQDACLSMFRCLRAHPDLGFLPRPNFVHLFVVLSAYLFDLPVFTVNFDAMFELACEELGIPYTVFLHNQVDEYRQDAVWGARRVRICKAHGSVGTSDGEGLITTEDIKTTAHGISEPNPWSKVIAELMEDHDCALIGYSGRDIDLYPSIRSASLRRLRSGRHAPDQFAPLLWLNRFKNDDVESAKARECGAVMLYGYPSEVLPGCLGPLRDAIIPSHQDELRMFDAVNVRTHGPRNEGAALRLAKARDATIRECVGKLPVLNEDLLCVKILVQWQRNISASRFLAEHGEALGEAASSCDQRELLTLRTRVSREIADLIGYARCARRLLRLERSLGDRAPGDELIWARLEVISAYYLRIPNFDTSRVGYAWWVRCLMALGAACVWARLRLLRMSVLGRGALSEHPAGRSAVMQEVENRLLALEFHMLGALHLPRPVLEALRDRLEARLADLGRITAECANTSTVKGVIRRISLLGLADDARFSAFYQDYRETFDTFPDKSQLGSLRRDEGTLEGASASLEAARETGNTLNELKALVAIESRAPGSACDELARLLASRRCDHIGLLNRAHLRRFLDKTR